MRPVDGHLLTVALGYGIHEWAVEVTLGCGGGGKQWVGGGGQRVGSKAGCSYV